MTNVEMTRKKDGALRAIWYAWKRVARKIGDFQARVLLLLFYFVFLTPFALGLRWWSDPLSIKPKTARGWLPKPDREGGELEQAARQS